MPFYVAISDCCSHIKFVEGLLVPAVSSRIMKTSQFGGSK
jgi:hypothetical protein